MKKLIPLLVIAAGAVAYSVYKNKKEGVKEEKTLVIIDDTPSNDLPSNDSPVEEVIEEVVEEITEEVTEEVTEEPIPDPVEEAVQEVQEELGAFETLSDSEEPYERPSFFHLTDDSYLEPEESPSTENEVVDDNLKYEEVPVEQDTVQEESEEPALIVLETEEETEAVLDEGPVVEAVEETTEEVTEELVIDSVEEVVQEDDVFVPFFDLKSEPEVVEEEPFSVEDAIDEIVQKVEELPAVESAPVIDVLETEEEVLQSLPSYDTPEVDELMKTIAGQVKAADESEKAEEPVVEVEEPVVVETVEEETDYLQDIRKITEMYSDKVAQYNIRYPYLSSRFINDTLKFSQQFNSEYPQGTRVAIEHHTHFDAVEDLFVFAQIIRQSGYSVREGTEDRSLIVTKEMYVDTNSILHDVFKVANQAYCLSGEYQKFRISKR